MMRNRNGRTDATGCDRKGRLREDFWKMREKEIEGWAGEEMQLGRLCHAMTYRGVLIVRAKRHAPVDGSGR